MQLSTILPVPPPTPPAAAPLPAPDGNPGTSPDAGATAFSQYLPPQAPPQAPEPKQEKKGDPPTASGEELTAAVYAGWLAAAASQTPPSPVLGEGTLPKVGAAGARSPFADGFSRGIASESSSGPVQAPQAFPGVAGGKDVPAAGSSNPVAGGRSTPQPPEMQAVPPQVAAQMNATPAHAAMGKAQPAPAAQSQAPASAPAVQPAPSSVPPDAALSNPRVAPAAMNPGRHRASAGVEKIAASFPKNAAPAAPASRGADKKILSSSSKQVTEQKDSVGIAVAKVDPAMPSSTPAERQPNALVAAVPVATVATAPNPAPTEAQPATPQGVAQRAVEAALSAAEVFNSGGHQAVNLQFSVGNADLSLRVELRNGEIHTTFRTDSADLRSDLAKEWQSAGPTSGSLRLAEPVFTTSGAPASAAGEGSPQQRGGQGRSDTTQASPHAPIPSSQALSSQGSVPARLPSALSTSLHLQAFA